MADVFLSYSRRDTEVVRHLAAAPQYRGREVFVDAGAIWRDDPSSPDAPPGGSERVDAELQGILPSARWMDEIRSAIAGADAVVVVLTPAFVASSVCRAEFDHAVALHKRIVPVLAAETDPATSPPELSAIHWLPLSAATWDTDVDRLVEVLDTDIDSVHLHTRLLVRATEWKERGEDRSLLLRGRDLAEAEAWLAGGSQRKPAPTPLQGALVLASRRASQRRQRTMTIVAASVAVALAVLGAVAGVQWRTAVAQRKSATHERNVAVAQRKVATSQRDIAVSRDLASESGQVLTVDPQLALILALRGYDTSPTAQAEAAVRTAELDSTVRAALPLADGVKTYTSTPEAFDPTGQWVVLGAGDTVRAWRWAASTGAGSAGHPITIDMGSPVSSAVFAPSGDAIVLATTTGTVERWMWHTSAAPTRLATGLVDPVLSPLGTQAATIAAGGELRLVPLGGGGKPVSIRPAVAIDASNETDGPAADFSPDGRYVAVPSASGSVHEVQIFSTATGQADATVDAAGVYLGDPIAFSPDDARLAVGAADAADIYEIAAPATPVVDQIDSPPGLAAHCCDVDLVTALAWSPSGDALAVGTDDEWTRIWVGASTTPIYLDDDTDATAEAGVAFSPDGLDLLTSGGASEVWAWQSATWFTQSLGATASAAAFDPDSATVAIATTANKILLWNVARLTTTVLTDTAAAPSSSHPEAEELTYSADGRYLAVMGSDGVVRVWQAGTSPSAPIAALRMSGLPQGSDALGIGGSQQAAPWIAFDPSGDDLAFVEKTSIVVWPWSKEKTGDQPTSSVALRGSTTALIAAFGSNSVQYMDVSTSSAEVASQMMLWHPDPSSPPTVLSTTKAHGRGDTRSQWGLGAEQVALIDHGDDAIFSTEGGTLRWDLATGAVGFVLNPHTYDTSAMSVGKGGSLVAFAGFSGQISVWDEHAGDVPATVATTSNASPAPLLSPDGATVVSLDEGSTTAAAYPTADAASFATVVALARSHVVRALTPSERQQYLPKSS